MATSKKLARIRLLVLQVRLQMTKLASLAGQKR
jgi:hypothetical protein